MGNQSIVSSSSLLYSFYIQIFGYILEMCKDRGKTESLHKYMLHLHGGECDTCPESEDLLRRRCISSHCSWDIDRQTEVIEGGILMHRPQQRPAVINT